MRDILSFNDRIAGERSLAWLILELSRSQGLLETEHTSKCPHAGKRTPMMFRHDESLLEAKLRRGGEPQSY